MNFVVQKIRNELESRNLVEPLLNFVTKSRIYKIYIYKTLFKKIKEIKLNKNYSFAIEISSFCNAKCYFCPNKWMKRKKNIMSMEMFSTIVTRIKDEKIKPKQFNLAGTGETLTDKLIFKKIDLIKTNFPDAEVFFPTNLGLANEEIIKNIVRSKLDAISISLNADNEKDYKKIMILDYKNTLSNLNKLIEMRNIEGSKVKIYLTLAANPVNKDSINGFLKKWTGVVDGITVNWIHSWAGAVKYVENTKVKCMRYPCRSLYEQIIIHSNGDIPLCCVDYEGVVIGGNVKNDKILDSFYSKKMDEIRKLQLTGKIERIEMCSQCRFSERGLYWLV